MQIETNQGGARSFLAALVLLAIGVALGRLVDPADWGMGPGPPRAAPAEGAPAGRFGPAEPAAIHAGLETLELTLDGAAIARLTRTRERGLSGAVLVQRPEDTVSARVTHGELTVPAQVRIKGDLVDHIDTDKWSLRIECSEGSVLGMTRFSIQHPKTRDELWGWFVLEAARREGLLAPAVRFVNVVINGRSHGVYLAEEHFTKELLESQGRRDGPIVRLREDLFWQSRLAGRRPDAGAAVVPDGSLYMTEVEGFGETRLAKDAALGRRLTAALDQLRDLQRLLTVSTGQAGDPGRALDTDTPADVYELERSTDRRRVASLRADALSRYLAASELGATTVDDLLHTDSFATLVALASVLDAHHALAWINLRFYHDPLRDRLEPVIFDAQRSAAHGGQDLLTWLTRGSVIGSVLSQSPTYQRQVFAAAARLTDPAWLEGLLADLTPTARVAEAALDAEGLLPDSGRWDSLANLLRSRCLEHAQRLRPADPVNFAARLQSDGDGARLLTGAVVVEAWSTTAVPVDLLAFRFGNGREVPAADVLVDGPAADTRLAGSALMLPTSGRRLTFRLPVDERLSTLREVGQVADAARTGAERERDVPLQIAAVHRLVTDPARHTDDLRLRRDTSGPGPAVGRPPEPTLDDVLARHPFLSLDPEAGRLVVRPGRWDVAGDLVVPGGLPLAAGPGVTLRFEVGAVLLSASALELEGSEAQPVILEAADPAAGWAGLLVVDAPGKSLLTRVVVRATTAIARGGWQSTGGVTFYRSPVEMRFCELTDARCEDALNIIATELLLDEVNVVGGPSDAFDGDFVTGLVRRCSFRDFGGDGLDVSGSRVTVDRCRFAGLGDKAISVGESSEVEVLRGSVRGASLGLVAKDGSSLTARGTRLADITYYVLAAFTKKEVYGGCTLTASDLDLAAAGAETALVQIGSRASLDGQLLPAVAVDVERLYAEGILGN